LPSLCPNPAGIEIGEEGRQSSAEILEEMLERFEREKQTLYAVIGLSDMILVVVAKVRNLKDAGLIYDLRAVRSMMGG
jgi:hypothetical protein